MAILRLPFSHRFEMSEVEAGHELETNKCNECDINYDDLMDFSYPYGNCDADTSSPTSRSASSSFSDTNSVTSEDGGYSNLEMHHFHKALNQGVFNQMRASNKKDRKKSFNKGFRKSDEDVSELSRRNSATMTKQPRLRTRSTSFDTPKEKHVRKKSKDQKIKTALSNSGIDLHHVDDKLSIDEIHELQQNLFSNLNIEKNKKIKKDQLSIGFNNTNDSEDTPLWNTNVFTRRRSATFM